MELSKLHIKEFRHLKNLSFDFTYPNDFYIEEKRGKSLDKICFIGQSATGKTGLLELIFNILNYTSNLEKCGDKHYYNKDNKFQKMSPFFKGAFNLETSDGRLVYNQDIISYKNFELKCGTINQGDITDLIEVENFKNVIFIKSEILSNQNLKFFEEDIILLIEKYKKFQKTESSNTKLIPFSFEVSENIWVSILEDNIKYLQNFLQFANELINSGNVLDNSFQKKIEQWKQNIINPNINFSKKFNPILDKLNLEIDLINTELFPIKNKITNEIIPIQTTSTGTKQLLLTSIPLFKLDTKDSIILIDEPERSLYPDLQMDIMEHYQNLAPKAQFIVATHSPFIAASFEPCERFILYFDNKGKVSVRNGVSPIGDDPNDVLKNDFGLEFLMNKHGLSAFEKYKLLKAKLSNEKDENKKIELAKEILSLANMYKF